MTRYYKTRSAEPSVYVQEEGRWQGYAPGGMLQRSTGLIPQVILAGTVEITRDEAGALIAAWRARAENPEQRGPAYVESQEARPTVYGPDSRATSRRPRWLPLAAGGVGLVIVIVVLAVLAVTGVFAGGSSPDEGATTDPTDVYPGSKKVVATMGIRKITQGELDRRAADFKAEYGGQIPDKDTSPDQYKVFQEYVLDYLITYELARQKAAELNIIVTDQDVQSQMDLILSTTFAGDQAKFDQAVSQQGLSMEQFKRMYRESSLFSRVYAAVTKDAAAPDTAWQQWIEQAKAAAGVKYADGWEPTTTTAVTTAATSATPVAAALARARQRA